MSVMAFGFLVNSLIRDRSSNNSGNMSEIEKMQKFHNDIKEEYPKLHSYIKTLPRIKEGKITPFIIKNISNLNTNTNELVLNNQDGRIAKLRGEIPVNRSKNKRSFDPRVYVDTFPDFALKIESAIVEDAIDKLPVEELCEFLSKYTREEMDSFLKYRPQIEEKYLSKLKLREEVIVAVR